MKLHYSRDWNKQHMSVTQLVCYNALLSCNATATAHCRANGANCSKQGYATGQGFSSPKVNASVFLHMEACFLYITTWSS